MKKYLFNTEESWAGTIIRVMLGIVMFPHGAQKLLGWFGGFGFTGTMEFLTGSVGLPWIVGFFVITLEFFGAIALILGFATRIIGISFFFLLLGIVFTSHTDHGFFMNWLGTQKGEGVEYFLLALGMSLALAVTGGGRMSLDRFFGSGFKADEVNYI